MAGALWDPESEVDFKFKPFKAKTFSPLLIFYKSYDNLFDLSVYFGEKYEYFIYAHLYSCQIRNFIKIHRESIMRICYDEFYAIFPISRMLRMKDYHW